MEKRFDFQLFKENDAKAKAFVKGLLFDSKFTVVESPLKTGVDLWVYENANHIAFIECEVKSSWDSVLENEDYNFPFEEINFPKRKLKFTGLGRPTIFFMLNKDLTNFLWVTEETMLKSPIAIQNTRYSTNESFIKVSRDDAVIGGDLGDFLLESPWRLKEAILRDF